MLAATEPHLFNMQEQGQDDLAALFARGMQLDSRSLPEPVRAAEDDKIVYISAHYTPSYFSPPPPTPPADSPSNVISHQPQLQEMQVRRSDKQPQQVMTQPGPFQTGPFPQTAITSSSRPASEPPHFAHATVESVLRNHRVDPSALSSAQLELFKTSAEPHQRRLIELWSLCPPPNSNDNPTLAWCSTSLEQEEVLAEMRIRQHQRQAEALNHQKIQMQRGGQEITMSLDGTPLTPVQEPDGRWMVPLANSSVSYMEPYMATGYEDWARREYEESVQRAVVEEAERRAAAEAACGPNSFFKRAMDPVYRGPSTGIGCTNGIHYQRRMEDEYGRVIAYRCEDTDML